MTFSQVLAYNWMRDLTTDASFGFKDIQNDPKTWKYYLGLFNIIFQYMSPRNPLLVHFQQIWTTLGQNLTSLIEVGGEN